MAKIYTFPTTEDIQVIKTAVTVFLRTQSGLTRDLMCGAMRMVLDKYGASKLGLGSYIVMTGADGGVRIVPREFTQDRACPGCGADIYSTVSGVTIISILEGDSGDVVTYGCQCGKVFGKWEGKWRMKRT